MSHSKLVTNKKNRRPSRSGISAYLNPFTHRFKIMFRHAILTYQNSKLILHILRESKSVDTETKSHLVKLLILRIVFLVLHVAINVGISYPMNWYSTALNERREADFWFFLKVFVCIVCVTAPIFAADQYIHNVLSMRFRQTLTNMLFDLYMNKRSYYHLRFKSDIDNPGQRFGQDIKSFAYGLFDLLNVILKHALNLLGFSYVLYTIDSSAVPILIIYSLCGTVFALTVFSRKLTELGYILMKDQSEFIANIIRINDSSESIALYNAAKHERNWLKMRLETLISDGITNCKWTAGLDLFSQIFHFLSIVVPYVLLAQQYFEKKIEFGELSQSIYAFSALLKALNIIINNIPTITSLSATSDRVASAINAVYLIHKEHDNNNDAPDIIDDESENTQLLSESRQKNGILSSKIITYETRDITLKLDNISYFAPNSDYMLLHSLSLALSKKESLLIVGFSGCGKSSLLRVISGLWNSGNGYITRPKLKHCIFLPQKPYIPSLPLQSNTLRAQLLFPKYLNDKIITNADENEMKSCLIDDKYILSVLDKINLTHLDTYSSINDEQSLLYCRADWGNCLSMGEQQRLAIGRCIVYEPNIIFADECTAALDSTNEGLMYRQLKDMNVPLISVGHHHELAKYHDFVLQFKKDGEWELFDSKQFINNL